MAPCGVSIGHKEQMEHFWTAYAKLRKPRFSALKQLIGQAVHHNMSYRTGPFVNSKAEKVKNLNRQKGRMG